MKTLITSVAALALTAGFAMADSAFSDAFGTLDTDLDIDGSGGFDTLDTGFSFGAWGAPSTSGVNFNSGITATAAVSVDADAVEPANFGSDQAFADVVINGISDLQGGFAFTGSSADLGSAGSFASNFGNINFDTDADTFGSGTADANDD